MSTSSLDQYSISHKTTIVIKPLLLLHPTLSAPLPNFELCPSSQQILATPLLIRLQYPMMQSAHGCKTMWQILQREGRVRYFS